MLPMNSLLYIILFFFVNLFDFEDFEALFYSVLVTFVVDEMEAVRRITF